MTESYEADDRRRLDDDELVARVRDGDTLAFDELYRRHSATARRSARWMTHSDHAADDVVADVFAGMLSALRNGRGPQGNFTAYLRASVRNRCIAHRKAAIRALPTDDEEFDSRPADGSTSDTSATSQLVATAFAALTPRWQRTLWMSEVEGRSAKDIGAELNLPAAAVPALAYRARRAFAEAYLQQHAERASDSACRAVAEKLPRYVRKSASRRDMLKVDLHLEHCTDCQRTVAEMSDLNMSLRSLPAPPVAAIAAGAGGVAAWLAAAAAIGAVVIVPALTLRGDESPNAAGKSTDVEITAPAEATPLPTAGPDHDGPAASTSPAAGSTTSAAAADPSVPPAPATTGPTPVLTDDGAGGTLPGLATAPVATRAPVQEQTIVLPDPTAVAPTLPVSPTTIPTVGTLPPLLPAITVPLEVPLPAAPVAADVSLSGDGLGVGADVGLPAGLGGVDAGVSVGGDGVQATVVLPTVPLVGTLPPVVVDVPLPQPIAQLVDSVFGTLLGAP